MGSGQSTNGMDDHIRRWEMAIRELESISNNTRRLMGQDRIHPDTSGQVGSDTNRQVDEDGSERSWKGVRRPSLVSFNHNQNANNTLTPTPLPTPTTTIVSGNLAGASAPQVISINATSVSSTNSNKRGAHENRPSAGFSFGNQTGVRSGSAGNGSTTVGSPSYGRHTRQQTIEIKKNRVSLFKSYELIDFERLSNLMECSHFGAAAAALSYLLGGSATEKDRRKRVTVEDIFFAAQVPLHMLHTGAPHLTVMTDIIKEFIDVDNRFKGEFGVEEVHLDISPTVGQVDLGNNEVGDRQTRMQLPEFRKEITHECEEETQTIRIVNYDPYVLEQEMMVDAYEEEGDLTSPLATSVLGNPVLCKRNHTKNNDGAYAAIVDVRNAVQLMVTIAEGLVNDRLHVKLTEVSAAALFKAMMCAEEGRRARGFIRIFRREGSRDFNDGEIKMFFTPELCSGKVLGTTFYGTHASAISHQISPHIVAVAWAVHLLSGVRPDSHGYGNGLPVSDIIRKMQFPSEVFLNGSLQLDQVYTYALKYLRLSKRDISVAFYPLLTKISREDAVPTISVFDLESVLIDVKDANHDPEEPEHIMVIMYNANVAHNVIHISDDPQWCVLVGYDMETQVASLIDAHPKTFSRNWTCSLDRLHKAMTGNGYLIFSKPRSARSSRASSKDLSLGPNDSKDVPSEPHLIGCPPEIAPMVRERLELLEKQNQLQMLLDKNRKINTFTFPRHPSMVTIIAMACTKLGIFTTFEDVIFTLPFEVSSLIIRIFTLESFCVCLRKYLKARSLCSEFSVEVFHGEADADKISRLPLDLFTELIQISLNDPRKLLILLFDPEMLDVRGVCHPHGRLGIVAGYDPETSAVTVCDSNPDSYLRHWTVPLVNLFNAITDNDQTSLQRTRGCLLLSSTRPEPNVPLPPNSLYLSLAPTCSNPPFPLQYSRSFNLEFIPVHSAFHRSPSPQIQGLSLGLCQLQLVYGPEEIFYEAFLKTMNDQKRRGSQAFAWRDVEVSLSVIHAHLDSAFVAQVLRKFWDSRKAAKKSNAPAKSPLQSKLQPNESADGERPSSQGAGKAEGLLSSKGNLSSQKNTLAGDEVSIEVEVIEEADVEDLDTILKDATRSLDENNHPYENNTVLLLNYDILKGRNLPNLGRSVALVKSYNPEARLVELWEAEYVVFGLSWVVSLDKLMELGDFENEGKSPYGFIKITKVAAKAGGKQQKKLGLMSAPKSVEEEAEQEDRLAGQRRGRDQMTKFL